MLDDEGEKNITMPSQEKCLHKHIPYKLLTTANFTWSYCRTFDCHVISMKVMRKLNFS